MPISPSTKEKREAMKKRCQLLQSLGFYLHRNDNDGHAFFGERRYNLSGLELPEILQAIEKQSYNQGVSDGRAAERRQTQRKFLELFDLDHLIDS